MWKKREASAGFEPAMADLQSAALATWPRRHIISNRKLINKKVVELGCKFLSSLNRTISKKYPTGF